MSLFKNIALVAADFATHPFSHTDATTPDGERHAIILTKSFGAPTIAKTPRGIGPAPGPIPGANQAGKLTVSPKIYARAHKGMPAHKIALWFFIVLTAVSLGTIVSLAFLTDGQYSDAQKQAIGLLDWGVKMGLGAIAGVVTGKASSLPNA